MCFAIFLDLNEFLEQVGKSFVGASAASTSTKNQFVRGGWSPHPPLQRILKIDLIHRKCLNTPDIRPDTPKICSYIWSNTRSIRTYTRSIRVDDLMFKLWSRVSGFICGLEYPGREEEEGAQIFIDIFWGRIGDEPHLQSPFLGAVHPMRLWIWRLFVGAAEELNCPYKSIFCGGSNAAVSTPYL